MFGRKNETTKTRQTKIEYHKRALSKLKKCFGKSMKDFNDQIDMVEKLKVYLIENRERNNLKQNTWRKYRAELKYFAEHYKFKNMEKMVNELPRQKLENPNITEVQKKGKYKFLPVKLYQKIKEECLKERTAFSRTILNWIDATAITGIRPKEWISVSLALQKSGEMETELPILRIRNAKNTNGRTFGDWRYIILTDVTKEEMGSILHMIELAKEVRNKHPKTEHETVWATVFDQHRKALYEMNNKLSPKKAKRTLTLYSARHQFAADCKANNVSDYEIAALMGHGSVTTHAREYGKKHLGVKGKFRVKAPKAIIQQLKTENNIKAVQKKEQKLDYTTTRVINRSPKNNKLD